MNQSQTSPAAPPATGSRRVLMSPTPHYSPVSPPLAGPSGNSVAPMRTWSNNTATGTSSSAQNTQSNFIPANSSRASPSSASSRSSSAMGMSPSHGLHSPGTIASGSNSPMMSPATQHTPAAPLFSSLRGLLQVATAAPTHQSSQSQSTAGAPPQSSMALVRSASSKNRTHSQASQSGPFNSSSVAPPQPWMASMSTVSQAWQSQSHPFNSSSAAPHQRSMGTMSTVSQAWQSLSQPFYSSSAAPLQPSMGMMSTPAAPSSAVGPPQVNLLNILMNIHCFQHLVLSPLISIN